MVTNKIQSEILLELVFAASGEIDEQRILKKAIPLYLRKLNCFLAAVIKSTPEGFQEAMLIPYVAGRSQEWAEVRKQLLYPLMHHFKDVKRYCISEKCYFAFGLNGYGTLVLGRKKPFDEFFLNELKPVVNSLGKVLMQAVVIEQREQAELSLKESEKRLRTLADTTTAGIFIYSNHRILYANHAAEMLCGYSAAELKDKNMISMIHPIYRSEIRKVNVPAGSTLEIKIIRKDGREAMLEVNVGFILWDEQPAAIISAFDISDRKKLEAELRSAKEKAEESDQLKTAFLANMSHEIRTPMNGILGFASLLKEPKLSGEDMQEYIEIIEQSGARMLNIINDLIDISKVEAGLVEMHREVININEQLDYLALFFEPEANSKSIQLQLTSRLPESHANIYTDGEKLLAVLTNLVKNALKFTPAGSISFGCRFKANRLKFFVKDTGIGIPLNRQHAIFDRFVQADIADTRAAQGAGLGLSISKAYVEMLGGQMLLWSRVDRGSLFFFDIPYSPAKAIPQPDQAPAEVKTLKHPVSFKVLIAEDDRVSQLLIGKICNKLGCTILFASDGLEVVERCRENPDIDLILMDIKMPGLDGNEATRIIREFNPHVTIIAQTAFGLISDCENALQAGCNDYIAKPVQKSVLIEKIVNEIEKRSSVINP